jgi:hypothetical protein
MRYNEIWLSAAKRRQHYKARPESSVNRIAEVVLLHNCPPVNATFGSTWQIQLLWKKQKSGYGRTKVFRDS